MWVRAKRDCFHVGRRPKGGVFPYEQTKDENGKPKPLPDWLEEAEAPDLPDDAVDEMLTAQAPMSEALRMPGQAPNPKESPQEPRRKR